MSLDIELTIFLTLVALISSIVSGMTGMAGGIMLLSFMAPFFSPLVLIPLHGLVQWVSNLSRTILLRPHVDRKIIGAFMIGAVVGTVLGTPLVNRIPEAGFRLVLGLFILIMTWMPKLKGMSNPRSMFMSVGVGAGFLSLFIGASGPFIAPFFLHAQLSKEGLVATKAFCQFVLHTTKMVAYFISGFVLWPWLGLLAWMIPAVILGNYLGKKILLKVPEEKFRLALKVLISLAAFRVLAMGVEEIL